LFPHGAKVVVEAPDICLNWSKTRGIEERLSQLCLPLVIRKANIFQETAFLWNINSQIRLNSESLDGYRFWWVLFKPEHLDLLFFFLSSKLSLCLSPHGTRSLSGSISDLSLDVLGTCDINAEKVNCHSTRAGFREPGESIQWITE
jgi:hypothetical protein